MKKLIILSVILMLMIIGLSGCIGDTKKPLETISLYEGEIKIILGLEIKLIDANSGYWKADCTATLVVNEIYLGKSGTLILTLGNNKQTLFNYTFVLKRTSHKGAIIDIYSQSCMRYA